jgi:hypothetical protein
MLENLPPTFGRVLADFRAGWDNIAFNRIGMRTQQILVVQSLAFADHAPLPQNYTADGLGDFPPINWQGEATDKVSYALLVEDADSPTPNPLLLFAAVNLPASCMGLDEPRVCDLQDRGQVFHRWSPPDPPPGHGVHRYAFQLFALRGEVPKNIARREKLLAAVSERCIGKGLVVATYERNNLETDLHSPRIHSVVAP